MQVRWGEIVSSQFSVSNGVKQGGVMSPVLFTVYLDNLLKNLRQCNIGCKIGATYSNYDSLFARTVAYPVQVAYWNQRGHSPLRIQCPMSDLTSGPETWPWGPVGW